MHLSLGHARAGGIAGSTNSAGYLQIRIDGHRYLLHRLAWLYVTGEWPEAEMDHQNGDRADNRFCNLRPATNSENGRNRGGAKRNTSGFKGVSWDARLRKWKAKIVVNGHQIYLGLFDNPIHAWIAYREAALKYHGEFAPGALAEDAAVLALFGFRRLPVNRISPLGQVVRGL